MKYSLMHKLSKWVNGDLNQIGIRVASVPEWSLQHGAKDLGEFFHEYRYHNLPLSTPIQDKSLLDRIHAGVLNVTAGSQPLEWKINYLPNKVSPAEILSFLAQLGFSASLLE